MSHRDAVLALRRQIRDAGFTISTDVENGGLKRTAKSLSGVHFLTTGGNGDIRVLMAANRTVVKLAIRPGSLQRYDRSELGRTIRETIQEAEAILHDALSSLKETR